MYYLLYETTNLVNGKRYIGVHKTEDLDDGYFGSGVAIMNALKKYGEENFVWHILKYCKDEEEMYAEEARIVNEEWIARRDNYNIKIGGDGGWDHLKTRSSSHRNAISKALKGVKKGPLSEEHKQKISKAQTGRKHSVETCKKRGNSLKGKIKSEKHRTKISNTLKTRFKDKNNHPCTGVKKGPLSEEHKEKLREASAKRKELGLKPNLTFHVCPHCKKEGRGPNMKRYHFDNCKKRKGNQDEDKS